MFAIKYLETVDGIKFFKNIIKVERELQSIFFNVEIASEKINILYNELETLFNSK